MNDTKGATAPTTIKNDRTPRVSAELSPELAGTFKAAKLAATIDLGDTVKESDAVRMMILYWEEGVSKLSDTKRKALIASLHQRVTVKKGGA